MTNLYRQTLRRVAPLLFMILCSTTTRTTTFPITLLSVEAASGSAAHSALVALKSLDYRYFVAGGTCAAISHGITTPIDVVKTRKQSDPLKYKSNMVSTAVDIWKSDGPNALLGGLGPTVVGYGIEGAAKFGVYEVMKAVFRALFSDNIALAYLLASVVAGAVAAVLLCPMESTRIKIVTDPAYADKGLLSGLPKMLREEGLWTSFGGIWAMLAKQIPYTLGKQVSFDVFAGMLYAFFHSIQDTMSSAITDTQIKWAVSISAAFMASIVACIFSQPGDMILTETYKKGKHSVSSSNMSRRIATKRGTATVAASAKQERSFTDVIRTIYAKNGLATFFTGTGARIVHVGLIITSQLVIYDVVKQLLGLPATGSH
jgi:solute carrier family 25 (mitochondrial phosphate transporter), member 3